MLCGSCYVSDLKETIQTHLQSRETRRLRGGTHGCCGVGEGAVREVGMGVDTLPCLKRVSSEDALHRALCRVVCGGWRGRSLGEDGRVCTCGRCSSLCTSNSHNTVNQLASVRKEKAKTQHQKSRLLVSL